MNKKRRGLLFFLLSLLVGSLNDALTKSLAQEGLSEGYIIAFRFLFGSLLLALYGGISGKLKGPIPHPKRQIIRGVAFMGGSIAWGMGLRALPLTTVTLIEFTLPLFTLWGRQLFFGIKISKRRWGATWLAMAGLMALVLHEGKAGWPAIQGLLALFSGLLLFVFLDLFNSHHLEKEGDPFAAIFYPNLLLFPLHAPLFFSGYAAMGSFSLFFRLLLLAFGGVAITYALFSAYALAPITYLAPFRYLNFVWVMCLDYCFFGRMITPYRALSALWVMGILLFIALDAKSDASISTESPLKKKKKRKKSLD